MTVPFIVYVLAAGLATQDATTTQSAVAGRAANTPVTTDTTIRVRAGMRLNVDLAAGSITVRSWDRQEVRIVAARLVDARLVDGRLLIDTASGALNVRTRGGRTDVVQYQITVPRAMHLTLGRGDIDVDVAGTEAEIVVMVRKGTIAVDGGRGLIDLRTLHGDIAVVNARGRIAARTHNSDIRVTDSGGDIEVEGADGDVVLARLDAERVNASTVDGRITYEGPLRRGGHYTFATHEQGVRLVIPASSGATITMATAVGRVRSDFPFTSRTELGKGRFSFVVGDGSAQVSLSAFDGLVEVRRLAGDRD